MHGGVSRWAQASLPLTTAFMHFSPREAFEASQAQRIERSRHKERITAALQTKSDAAVGPSLLASCLTAAVLAAKHRPAKAGGASSRGARACAGLETGHPNGVRALGSGAHPVAGHALLRVIIRVTLQPVGTLRLVGLNLHTYGVHTQGSASVQAQRGGMRDALGQYAAAGQAAKQQKPRQLAGRFPLPAARMVGREGHPLPAS